MTVYFHGNFGLNREYMAGVLAASLKDPGATAEEIATPFGYKAPFTARYKSWLNKTGIATAGKTVELTPTGKVVWNNDPALKSLVTQWLLHHELTNSPERAEAWHYFAHDFIKQKETFTLDELRAGLSMKLMTHHPTHFGRDAPMIKVIARKIAQCYTQPEALGGLGLITGKASDLYVVEDPKQLGPWKSPSELEVEYKQVVRL